MTNVVQLGLGPIGLESLKLAATKPWLNIIGAVDVNPDLVGKSLATLLNQPQLGALAVVSSVDQLTTKPDVILHTAASSAKVTCTQIMPWAAAGISVVSTCEELIFPWHRAPAEAQALHDLCQKSNARVVATGVNPGFVMDLLPITLTGVCRSVERIYVKRVVDASTRRMQLQKKIGSGWEKSDFEKAFAAGRMGHAGLQESALLIAHALGWSPQSVTETCSAVLAERDIKTLHFSVPAGKVRGLHQRCIIRSSDRDVIELDLTMALDEPDPHDAIRIHGTPPLDLRLQGGVAGDHATTAALINAIPALLRSAPGLHLLTDLAVPCHH